MNGMSRCRVRIPLTAEMAQEVLVAKQLINYESSHETASSGTARQIARRYALMYPEMQIPASYPINKGFVVELCEKGIILVSDSTDLECVGYFIAAIVATLFKPTEALTVTLNWQFGTEYGTDTALVTRNGLCCQTTTHWLIEQAQELGWHLFNDRTVGNVVWPEMEKEISMKENDIHYQTSTLIPLTIEQSNIAAEALLLCQCHDVRTAPPAGVSQQAWQIISAYAQDYSDLYYDGSDTADLCFSWQVSPEGLHLYSQEDTYFNLESAAFFTAVLMKHFGLTGAIGFQVGVKNQCRDSYHGEACLVTADRTVFLDTRIWLQEQAAKYGLTLI